MSKFPSLRLVFLCGTVCLCGCAHPPRRSPSPPIAVVPLPSPLAGVTVVLDPGHGGEDPGARVDSISEASLTYRTASVVAARLREQGARVVFTVRSAALRVPVGTAEPALTEPTDSVLVSTGQPIKSRSSPRPLWARAAVGAREWKKGKRRTDDVYFLSLHLDDFHQPKVHGGLVCIDRRRPIPLLARALSAEFARANLGRPGWALRGVPALTQGRFGVLDPQFNPVPESVLLEVATLSNPADRASVLDPQWRQAVAGFVMRAVLAAHQNPTKKRPAPS